MLGGIWLEPGYDHEQHGNWWDIFHMWLSKLHEIDRETRTDPHAMVSAIPRGEV